MMTPYSLTACAAAYWATVLFRPFFGRGFPQRFLEELRKLKGIQRNSRNRNLCGGETIACVAGGIRGHKGGSLKYRLPKN